MKELINMQMQAVTLEDGTILAAAGSKGSVRHLESVSDADMRRLVDRGLIAVRDVEFDSTAAASATKTAAPAANSQTSQTSIDDSGETRTQRGGRASREES